MSRKAFAILAAGAASVSAHGIVLEISTGGNSYEGWNPNDVYITPTPTVAAWHAGGFAMGPITDYSSSSMNCHDNATAATTYMTAAAGADLNIVWGQYSADSGWPESHKGPIISYMAPCGDDATGDCTKLEVGDLKWTKVYQSGLITSGSVDEQVWATDKLRENNKTVATIPSALKAGNYVFRNEIIALHNAGTADGAQNYPQCYNVKVTGSGSSSLPTGTVGTALYTANDLIFNIYETVSSYAIPGPALWSAAAGSSGSSSSGASTPAAVAIPAAATPTTLQTVAKTTPATQATSAAPANTTSTGNDEYDC